MDKKFQVYANSLPDNLIAGFEPTVYVMEMQLRDSAVEYGHSHLSLGEIQKRFEIMKKRALDNTIQLYESNFTTENKFSKDGRLEISDLEGRCTGVMILSEPEIKPETIWLANFGIRNDTLHYKESITPEGSVNVEFIGYSPK